MAPIGAGGMGEVYRARDTKLDRIVAIKVLPEAFAADAERRARFEREAKAVAARSHPNILAIYDFGGDRDHAYAVMELLEGESLRDRLAHGALPLRKALEYASQTAQGLAAAHERGVVHRDLKPENLFVTRDGRVKILDFGLAAFIDRQSLDLSATPTVAHRGTESGRTGRCYIQALAGGAPRAVTPPGTRQGRISPDGRRVLVQAASGEHLLIDLADGDPRPVPSIAGAETIAGWSPDGVSVLVFRGTQVPTLIERVDLSTGRRESVREIAPPDSSGFLYMEQVSVAPEAMAYAYGLVRRTSQLYLVKGAQ